MSKFKANSRSMVGILTYKVTCKERNCNWECETDSTDKMNRACREHRRWHWENSDTGKAIIAAETRAAEQKKAKELAEWCMTKMVEIDRIGKKAQAGVELYQKGLHVLDKNTIDREEVFAKLVSCQEMVNKAKSEYDKYQKTYHRAKKEAGPYAFGI